MTELRVIARVALYGAAMVIFGLGGYTAWEDFLPHVYAVSLGVALALTFPSSWKWKRK